MTTKTLLAEYSTEAYEIVLSDDALGEDGNYGRSGYGIRNRETGVVEYTSTFLPSAIFQARNAEAMLAQLLVEGEGESIEPESGGSDVTLN